MGRNLGKGDIVADQEAEGRLKKKKKIKTGKRHSFSRPLAAERSER